MVERYYPRNQIPPKTQFFLEELFDSSALILQDEAAKPGSSIAVLRPMPAAARVLRR